jgi:uncharacterized protein (TIGR02145 family)
LDNSWEEDVYVKCDGKIYNPLNSFCYPGDNKVYELCGVGKKEYDRATQICEGGVVKTECGTGWHDTTKYYCLNGSSSSCGDKPYNPDKHFCISSVRYDKCGVSVEYAPGTEACCGKDKYTLATHSCYNGQTYSCNNQPYNPSTHFCDERDDKSYKYVKINNQIWMAENLNYNASGSRCYGDDTGGDNQNMCGIYGRLYDWSTAMTSCPAGWHLPSYDEWDTLITAVGISTELKANNGWHSNNGTDYYGFSALPSGCRSYVPGNFFALGARGYWWSATTKENDTARLLLMDDSDTIFGIGGENKFYLFSVRCVKDE